MLDEFVKSKDVKSLCRVLFPNYKAAQNLTKNQEIIVRIIAYTEHPRVCINAMTRYGKSVCVAMGIALYIILHQNKKIAIIAPQDEQTAIIRNYIAEIVISCPLLSSMLEIERDSSIERLKREASRKRWTFKNGCELRTLSAEGEAFRLMGFGADVVVVDEAARISRESYAKIVRMLGDDPENSILIELSNPWNKDCKYYDHYTSGRFLTICIGWEIALQEGRTTQLFIDEMRQEITPIEFTVLYESTFPEESEDALFKWEWIVAGTKLNFESKGKKVISCDPAEAGRDYTVIYWGYEFADHYKVEYIYSEPKSDLMKVAERIVAIYNERGADTINIDCIGIGAGVVSRVKQLLNGKEVKINACHFGEQPTEDKYADKKPTGSRKRFLNKKAEQFFRLSELMRERLVQIPEHQTLKSELNNIKWEKTMSERIKIQEPEDKSPDFACALCYFTWKSSRKPLSMGMLAAE